MALTSGLRVFVAAEEGHLEMVQFLVEKGARLNCIDKFGATPLRCAIAHHHSAVEEYLRSKGATVYLSAFSEGPTPETYVLSENELEHLRVIFNSIGAFFQSRDKLQVLF